MRLVLFFSIFFASFAYATILDSKVSGDVVYFIESESTQVKRFSLDEEAYLTPIDLSAQPLGFHVTDSHLFVSFGTNTKKMNLDGSSSTDFRTTSTSIQDIESIGNVIYLAGYSYIQSANMTTGAFIDETSLWYTSSNITTSSEQSAIFVRSAGISPSDINRVSVDTSGNFGFSSESPYHGDYAGGSICYVFPGNRVTDDSGTIYNAADLTYSTSLGGYFLDLKFWNDLPIVLRGQTLYSYNQAVLETGTYELALGNPQKIAIYSDKVFVFPEALDSVEIVDISEIDPADPAAPIDPTGLPYTPDATALDSDGDTLYLLSKANLNIFRWSISQEIYLDSIPLAAAPQNMAYSANHNRIYLTYTNGVVKYLDLNSGSESPFAALPGYVGAITAAGDYLVTRDDSGAWGSFRTFDEFGVEQFSLDWQYPTSEFVWSEVLNRIYYISGFSPSDLHYQALDQQTGNLGNDHQSIYHDSYGWSDPIRISETGMYIALGTGRVVDAESMTEQAYLNDTLVYYTDLVWLHGNTFTLRGVDSNTVSIVERWLPDYEREDGATYETTATPLKLFSLPTSDTLLLITQVAGIPQFTKLSYTVQDFDDDGYNDDEDLLPNNTNEWEDFDRDLIGNNADTDDDNDGYADSADAFPLNGSEWLDSDGDGTGDNADSDDDNDSVPDESDAFPTNPAESIDTDADGTGNNADTDDDNDGVLDTADAFPLDSSEWADADGDGIGNNADTDADNDGVPDTMDAYPTDPTRSTIVAADFLPLDSGNRWYYSNNSTAVRTGSSVSIGSVSITPLEFPSGAKLYLRANGQQISFYGVRLENLSTPDGTFDLDITNNQGIPLLSSGNTFGTGRVNITPTYGNRNTEWAAFVNYYGSESISVGAGTFEALHTGLDYWAETLIDGQTFAVNYHVDIWFAEDVGIVRIEEYGVRSNLTSFTQGSNSGGSSGGGNSGSGGGGSMGFLMLALLWLCVLAKLKPQHKMNKHS